MSSSRELSPLIMALRRLPYLTVESAEEVGAALQASVESDLAGGRSPDGVAWAPKKDGGSALANAASNALKRTVNGTKISLLTRGHYWAHQQGVGNTPARPVLPSSITPKMQAAMVSVIEDRIKGVLGNV